MNPEQIENYGPAEQRVTVGESTYLVTCDYTPAEIGGWDSPGYPESLEITGVRMPGSSVDLTDLLKQSVLDDIKEEMWRMGAEARRDHG